MIFETSGTSWLPIFFETQRRDDADSNLFSASPQFNVIIRRGRNASGEAKAEQLVQEELKKLRWREDDLDRRRIGVATK